MPQLPHPNSPDPLTVIELTGIIEAHLPGWQKACGSSEANAIVLHELAFGTSGDELLLLACAIKYAAQRGKNVHVVCGSPTRGNDWRRDLSLGPAFCD
jgi:hypothetical protein